MIIVVENGASRRIKMGVKKNANKVIVKYANFKGNKFANSKKVSKRFKIKLYKSKKRSYA